jgi:hypothetical protein
MSDWLGETNLVRIVQAARVERDRTPDLVLPPYLERQRREVTTG